MWALVLALVLFSVSILKWTIGVLFLIAFAVFALGTLLQRSDSLRAGGDSPARPSRRPWYNDEPGDVL
jgi:uncharacterized membrane protein YfhO